MLTRDGGIYLPPSQDVTQIFLRKLMQGHKKYLRLEKVKVIKIPQYKGLGVKEILAFASDQVDIFEYLPLYEYSKEPSREWL